jgi:hypothetical protein
VPIFGVKSTVYDILVFKLLIFEYFTVPCQFECLNVFFYYYLGHIFNGIYELLLHTFQVNAKQLSQNVMSVDGFESESVSVQKRTSKPVKKTAKPRMIITRFKGKK